MLHGGDYNPEQWDPQTWTEDDRLMGLAHVNSVTLGVFSWVSLEPEEGKFTFEWMDKIMDMQAAAGRIVGLATPSAASPAWLSAKYPDSLRVGQDGVRRRHGNRVNYCWTSPAYRAQVSKIATMLAERYKAHPALGYFHVSNEYGGECFCDLCQEAFRGWLKVRYGNLDTLNKAYWTAFWGHTYTDWSQIEAPGGTGETAVYGLTLDWKRFASDRIVDFYRQESGALKKVAPSIPVTTNLMGVYPVLDPWKIAPYMDFIAWDSYPWFSSTPSDLGSWTYTSFAHDLNRSLKNKPFVLMECSPSSSNWYPVMGLKRPNAHVLEGLQAVAHGADGVQYFQWRQSRGSSEQFHGAVVAHNNRSDARVFREVADLGRELESLDDVVGAAKPAEVALIYDWENSWAIDMVAAPRTKNRDYLGTVLAHYSAFWSQGVTVDVVDSDQDLSGYKLVVAPMLFLLKDGVVERLAKFVEGGGTLMTTYWSGWVDSTTLAFQGPSPLSKLLGLWTEETDALFDGQSNQVVSSASDLLTKGAKYSASVLCELVHTTTAESLASYGSDFYAGRPAVTRNKFGSGQAIFVASRNEQSFTNDLLISLMKQLGISGAVEGDLPTGITVQARHGDGKDFLFVLNCSDKEKAVRLGESGLIDLDGAEFSGELILPAFGTAILVRAKAGSLVGASN
jgi:beta-galactosidase